MRATPPGRRTRRISASATSLRVTLRRPNPMQTQSNFRAGNGSASALHWAAGTRRPSSSMRSRPATSMAALTSVRTTLPDVPTRSAKRRARSAVPPATSSTALPRRTPLVSTANRFQARCSPADMRSFMRSYFDATDSNTPRTRRAFSSGGTRSKPKSVVPLISLRVAPRSPSVVVTAGMRRRGRRGVRIEIAARTGRGEPRQISLPQLVLPLAQIVQIVPGVDAGVVTVGELRPDGVVADRLEFRDRDFALADLQRFLAGPVPAHIRRGRVNAEEFVGQTEVRAVGERQLHQARCLMQLVPDVNGRTFSSERPASRRRRE